MASRRDVLRGAAALPLVAVIGSPAALLWSSPARAWVPAALAVAQAGFQLYQMSKSGGGGIGKLLAAQVEMLRAIHQQLVVIGTTVSEIYEGVEQLKNMVKHLPLEVTRQMYRTEVRVVSQHASQLLGNALTNSQNQGLNDAIALDNGASQAALDRLGPAVLAVAADPSVLNVPLMALAWYTEYQVLTTTLPFNPARISSTASLYETYFQRQITELNSELAKIDTDVTALQARISASPLFEPASCYENVSWRMRTNTCGHDGNFTCYRGYVSGTKVDYKRSEEAAVGSLAEYLVAAADLEAAGAQMSQGLLAARVPSWTFSEANAGRNYDGRDIDERPYLAHVREVDSKRCVAGRRDAVANYHAVQNAVKAQADDLRLRAVLNGHLLLAAREALNSAQTIKQRVTTPTLN